VPRVADRDPAQRLNPLGDLVDQLILLLSVLIEQKMELVECRPPHQPVMLLVERIQDLGVGEDLVQALAGQESSIVGETQRKLAHGAEALDLLTMLVRPRLAAAVNLFWKDFSLGGGHVILLCTPSDRGRPARTQEGRAGRPWSRKSGARRFGGARGKPR